MSRKKAWQVRIELKEVHSTNQYLFDLTECQDVEHGTVVSAGFQSAGKGHGDASWESEPGKNILASIYLKEPCIPVEKQFYLSKATSIAIRDVLNNMCTGIRIKWPNDIYVRDRKIGGILIENTVEGTRIRSSIVGIGLNVNQEQFPAFIPRPASVLLETGNICDIKMLLENIVSRLRARYDQLCQGEYESIDQEYLGNLFRYGEECTFRDGKHTFVATVTGVRENGELELKTREGVVKRFSFKEVQYVS